MLVAVYSDVLHMDECGKEGPSQKVPLCGARASVCLSFHSWPRLA